MLGASALALFAFDTVGSEAAEASDLYFRLIYQAPGLYNHYHCAE